MHQTLLQPKLRNEVTKIPAEKRSTIILSWKKINVYSKPSKGFWMRTISPEKQLLKDATGVAYPGEILAVLGPSGSGKTTLLNALTFQSLPNIKVTGTVCCNGIPVTTNWAAYIQQDDLLIDSLTVREHLSFYSMLRMSSDLPLKYKTFRIEEVLEKLLLKKCGNTPINSISMGERRRLAFASEILTNPEVLICDEPTSGLDTQMAASVLNILKNIASEGKTIICCIHQSSSNLFFMFDKILLLAEGETVFLGTPLAAINFFNASQIKYYNLAEYIIKQLTILPEERTKNQKNTDTICKKCTNFVGAKQPMKLLGNLPTNVIFIKTVKISWWTQFSALFWRSWLWIIKDPALCKMQMFQIPLLAFVLGVIYFGQEITQKGVINISGAFFSIIQQLSFQTLSAVTPTLCFELPLFQREHRNGLYKCSAYIFSKFLSEILRLTPPSLLYAIICYLMIVPTFDIINFCTFCGIIWLTMCAAISYGIASFNKDKWSSGRNKHLYKKLLKL